MGKKEIIFGAVIFSLILSSFSIVLAENIIYGDPLPEAERLSMISISSDNFYFGNESYIYVKALNSNNEMIDLNSITIKPLNLTKYIDYKETALSQTLSKQYKQGFLIENESIKEITFQITAIKGDKTITQDYSVDISKPTQSDNFKNKLIASVNFLWDGITNNWGVLLIAIIVIFVIIFIIKGFNYLTK